jgi:hypothetical protein
MNTDTAPRRTKGWTTHKNQCFFIRSSQDQEQQQLNGSQRNNIATGQLREQELFETATFITLVQHALH